MMPYQVCREARKSAADQPASSKLKTNLDKLFNHPAIDAAAASRPGEFGAILLSAIRSEELGFSAQDQDGLATLLEEVLHG